MLRSIEDHTKNNVHGATETVPDVPRTLLKRNKVYSFARNQELGQFSASAGSPLAVGIVFQLAGLPGSADFTTLFDVYRIAQATVKIFPLQVVQDVPIYTAIDYDDASAPTTPNELLQKETLRICSSNTTVIRTLNPCYLAAAYQGVTSTGYSPRHAGWIDCANASVPYYGLKVFAPSLIPTYAQSNLYSITVEYIVQCKDIT